LEKNTSDRNNLIEIGFANTVRKPLVCEPRLASPTQFANLWFANRDCQGFPSGSLAMTSTPTVIARSEATKQSTLLLLRAWTQSVQAWQSHIL